MARDSPVMVVTPSEIVAMEAPGAKEIGLFYEESLDPGVEPALLAACLTEYDELSAMLECLPELFLFDQAAKRKTRYRYICPGCDTKVYGKWDLDIQCNDCDINFEIADEHG